MKFVIVHGFEIVHVFCLEHYSFEVVHVFCLELYSFEIVHVSSLEHYSFEIVHVFSLEHNRHKLSNEKLSKTFMELIWQKLKLICWKSTNSQGGQKSIFICVKSSHDSSHSCWCKFKVHFGHSSWCKISEGVQVSKLEN